ncbi:hypothetical protein [Legionella cincinnatiensis]|uniref:Dot/Icm secretion system substrate n=1 Tax=Legionella cincinnatiensis TaxID=28085 RepID=A0A378IPH7_9GAMM|nr:hypothetical protein [Legionella cincinnatiensis]KTC83301.1 substrate of the Dot/Icm secretion system [Legionella cincinnatiensis]STX36712.1 Dot/Icm secretion system substrate [Legionella cincinnatiensis]
MSYTKIESGLLLALDYPKLDESDFILLSTKLLEKKLGNNENYPAFLKQIQKHYLEQEYKKAIENILRLCKEHETRLGTNVVQRLITKASQITSDPKDNESRRFYEVLYAEHIESILRKDFDCSVFDELNEAYNEVRPEYTVNDLTKINTFEEARKLILAFVMLNDNVELGLKAQSTTYQKKDRSREELGQVLTANPGIMKPNSPNFADNRVAIKKIDKIVLDEKKVGGYSKTNAQVPFVASLSGTTYSLVVVLQKYMEKHKTDLNLEKKINNIVMLWTSAYIKDGYHSYKEVIDIFKDPHIHSIFAQANIKLDYAIIDDTAHEFHRAQEYAQGIATKSMMHQELVQKAQDKNAREEKQRQMINSCGMLIKQLNQAPKSKERYPEQLKSLDELYKNWSTAIKKNQEFKKECAQICAEIQTKEQNTPFSFTDFLIKIKNFFNRLFTSGFRKEVLIEPVSMAIDILTQLKDTVEQIPDSPTPKSLIRKSGNQPIQSEVKHFPSPIKEEQKHANGLTTELSHDSTTKRDHPLNLI